MISTGEANINETSANGLAVEIAAATTTASNGDVAAPVVFQCAQCKSIVGDSTTIVNMDAERRTISIKRKIDAIQVEEALNTSTREYDFGSTFHYFCCGGCKNLLGQMYRTTSAKLDHLREVYTYHSENLIFYQLFPDPEVMAEESDEMVLDGTTEPKENGQDAAELQNESSTIRGPTVSNVTAPQTSVEMELVKIQKFCLYLYDRVQKLEDQLKGARRKSIADPTK